MSGSRIGRLAAVIAATSPCAKGAIRRAVSTVGRQAASTAELPSNRLIPYTPASPTATPARLPARISASRLLAGLRAASLVIVGGTSVDVS